MDIIQRVVDRLQLHISKLKSQICNSEEAAKKLSSEEAAKKLGISRQTLWLYIEDGIAVPGREKIKLPVYQYNPGKQDGYRIDEYKLDCFRQQRKHAIRKGKRANNTNNLSGSQHNVSHIHVQYARVDLIALIIIALISIFITFAVYMYGPADWMTWTGLNGGFHKISTTTGIVPSPTTGITPSPQKITQIDEQPPAKTFWDYFLLLAAVAIPVVVGWGAALFTRQSSKESEQENMDNQRETALQAYINKMSELLGEKEPCLTKHDSDELRVIAQARTWRILHRLDNTRKGEVIRFLYSTSLIRIDDEEKWGTIINLVGADLKQVALRWAHLKKANLQEVDIREADLREIELPSADLYRSGLDWAKLNWANLSEANLKHAKLGMANLSEANLSKANLSEAILCGTNLCRANLSGANLSGADLYEADLHEANLSGTDLSSHLADLSKDELSEDELEYAKLGMANLSEANLSEANLEYAKLGMVNLRKAKLRKAKLSEAILCGANLCRANLSGANLSGADLYEANLSGANLSGADLSGTNITQEQWKKAKPSRGVTLPKEFIRDLRGASGRKRDLSPFRSLHLPFLRSHS